MNLKELVYLFCDMDEDSILAKPFEQDGYVCATDKHVCIRIPGGMINSVFETRKRPDIDSIIPCDNPFFSVSAEDLEAALKDLGVDLCEPYEDCVECDRNNNVEWEYTDINGNSYMWDFPCPVCVGTGSLHAGHGKYARFNDDVFSAEYIFMLYYAMLVTHTNEAKATCGGNAVYRFDLNDGVQVMLMPTKDNGNTATVKITAL